MIDELLLLQEVRELIFVAEEERDRHLLDLADLDLVCLVAFKQSPARGKFLEPVCEVVLPIVLKNFSGDWPKARHRIIVSGFQFLAAIIQVTKVLHYIAEAIDPPIMTRPKKLVLHIRHLHQLSVR